MPPGSATSVEAGALLALRRFSASAGTAIGPSGPPGDHPARRRGNGQEMVELRPYIGGDDVRHIDANAKARTGHWHVRLFREERDRTFVLAIDLRPTMLWGLRRAFRSVAAAEALAILGWRALAEGGRVDLYAVTGAGDVLVRPRGRLRGMLDVVGGLVRADAMARAAAARSLDDDALDRRLEGLTRIVPAGAHVAVASCFDTPGIGLERVLGRLARRAAVRGLWLGGDEAALPPGDYGVRLPNGHRVRARIRQQAVAIPNFSGLDAMIPVDAALGPSAAAKTLWCGDGSR